MDGDLWLKCSWLVSEPLVDGATKARAHFASHKDSHLENIVDPNVAVELVRQAVLNAMIIGSPLLMMGMLVGLVISLLQAVTQIQDQTLNAVPKIIAMVLALVVCMPWIADRMIQYTKRTYSEIPAVVAK